MGRKILGCDPIARFSIPGSNDPICAECCKITEHAVDHTVLDCMDGAKPLKSVRMIGCYIEPRTADGHIMDKKILDYTNSGSRSPGPAAYCVKTTIGPRATDPSIEKNPAYSMPEKKYKNVSYKYPWHNITIKSIIYSIKILTGRYYSDKRSNLMSDRKYIYKRYF